MADQTARQNAIALVFVCVIAVGVLVSGGLTLWVLRLGGDDAGETAAADVLAGGARSTIPTGMIKPASRDDSFIGSAKCVECHSDIHDSYQTHPMSHSMAAWGEQTEVEDWQQTSFTPERGQRRYEIGRSDGRLAHREVLFDEQGDIITQEEEIGFVLGSGQRGRSYVVNHEGVLFQSPIGWFSQEQCWDLSPGYKGPLNPHFTRRVADGCLYCHSGRVSTSEPNSGRYDAEPFFETAIGCERCHGPGRQHVSLHASGDADSADAYDSIVNPAKLPPAERDAVCYQCHLQGESMIPRYGHGFFDFRPGDRIEDIWVAFVAKSRAAGEGETRAVGQVEQMRSSKCFQNSDGQLGCISCHDPHSKPAPADATVFYNNKCASCHDAADNGCGLDEPQRMAAPAQGSCIACHMPAEQGQDVPHTSHTDHRVRRRPTPAPDASGPIPFDLIEVFAGAEQRLPPREVERARGQAMMSRTETLRNPRLLAVAEQLLIPAAARQDRSISPLEAIGDDVNTLLSLGLNLQLQKRYAESAECFEEVLKHDPRNEQALGILLMHYHANRDPETTLKIIDKLQATNPYLSEGFGRRTHILGQRGDLPGAVRSALLGIRMDPNNLQLQEWLVSGYSLTEQAEKSEAQAKLVERLQRALDEERGSN